MPEEEKENAVAVVESQPTAVKLSTQAIAIIAENVALAEQLVTSVMEHGVDYGRTPGTPQDGLWDPGASKIMAAFNCYPLHEVIFHEESDDLISWTIQAKLVHRNTQEVIGTGLGACSTREKKYKYRWVDDPRPFGYTEEEIKQLQFKDGRYRIENPEYGELVHTLLVMASKRAECDAAKSLPGVGSALRKLFDPRLKGSLPDEPDYGHFWGIVKGMGINEKSAHQALGVNSMKEWVGTGHTLDEAIMIIGKKLTELVRKKAKTQPEETKERNASTSTTPPDEGITLEEMTSKQVPDLNCLEFYASRFWGLEPEDVYREMGYRSRKNFEEAGVQEPWDAFLALKSMREEEPPEPEQDVIESEELPF
jgi:hypothetical protein